MPAAWNALLAAQAAPSPFMRHEYLAALHEAAAPRRRPAGRRASSRSWRGDELHGRAARCTSRTIPTASTCSTGPGPTPTSSTACAYYPKAAGRGAVHAGARAAPAGARRRARARAAARRCMRWCAQARSCPRCTCCSRRRGRSAACARGRPDAAPHRAVPLDEPRADAYADFDDFLASLQQRQAQEDPAGAAQGRRGRRHASAVARAARSRAADWDFFYRCYEPHLPRAQQSTPYLDARLLPRAWRATMPDNWLLFIAERDGKPIASVADRASTRRRRRRLRPLLGRARARRLPALRGLLLPAARVVHRARLSSASRAARRASTRWRAACCRCRPARATGWRTAFADAVERLPGARRRRHRRATWTN